MSEHHVTRPEDRISLKQKSAYAVGMLVNNLQAAALPAMVVILNLGLGMDVMLVGLIGSIPRIFDAISDPMVGYISDNTRTRWGRRRPFIFVGALLAGLIFAIMWQLPSGYIDILGSDSIKEPQAKVEHIQPVEKNDAGGIDLKYNSKKENDISFILYGPKENSVLSENKPISNLDGYPQLELNAELPEFSEMKVVFNEQIDLNTSESYEIIVTPDMMTGDSKTLLKLAIDEAKLIETPGIKGNEQLDLDSIKDIEIELKGIIGSGIATIHSLKLRKNENFYNTYFVYFLIMSIIFFLAYTLYATPFVAFGYEMTNDYHERTRLHAFANTIGQLVWLGVPWFYAIMASSLFKSTVHGARVLAIWVGALVAILGILPAIFLREKQNYEPVKNSARGVWKNLREFFAGLVTTFKCKPFVKLCSATFLVFNGFQLGTSFSIYVMIYFLFNGNNSKAGQLMGWFGSITSLATLVVIPLTGWIATKIGKRKTFIITISLSMLGYVIKWFGYNPAHPYWLLFAAPFVAFGTGSLFTLMGSMISDVCDLDELETHKRREGVFGAIYWWMVKIGMSISGLMTGVLLKFVHFDQALGANQPLSTLTHLRAFDVIIPFITSGIALWIIFTYSLSENKVYEIREKLMKRHKSEDLVKQNSE